MSVRSIRRMARDDGGGSSGPGNISGELYGGSSGSSGPGALANSVNTSTGSGNETGELYNSGGGSSGPGATDDDFDLGKEVETFLADKLSPEDMDTLISLFNRAIGFDPNDEAEARTAMDSKKMALDEAWEKLVKERRKRQYEAGQITYDHYRAPISPRPLTEAEQRAADQRRRELFGPNFFRLKA